MADEQPNRGLSLTRNEGEQIVCDLGNGEEVLITLVRAHRKQARLRILAPDWVQIWRAELEVEP